MRGRNLAGKSSENAVQEEEKRLRYVIEVWMYFKTTIFKRKTAMVIDNFFSTEMVLEEEYILPILKNFYFLIFF